MARDGESLLDRWAPTPVGEAARENGAVIAYLDESGAHGGPDDVFTLGGWVALETRWQRIEAVWDTWLGSRVFHMVDFENRYGDFANWPNPKKRIPLIAALADSIQGNEAFGTAHSVHLEPFKAIMCPPDAQMHHVKRFAYGMLLTGCLNDIIFRFEPPPNEQVSVVCEECEGIAGFAATMFDDFKRQHSLEGRLGGLTFMPKAAFRGLQARRYAGLRGLQAHHQYHGESRPTASRQKALHGTTG